MAFITGLESFRNTLKQANAAAQGQATAVYRKQVRAILKDLAASTPQFSGDLAASWQVVVGKGAVPEDKGYTNLKDTVEPGQEPHFKGDKAAISYALAANSYRLEQIRWNSVVSIANVSSTLTGGEGDKPLQEIDLRPGNFIPGDFMAVRYVAAKYSHRGGKGFQLTATDFTG